MNFLERKEKFREELFALGEKYQIGLVGTCGSEGIYGEIMFVDMTDMKSLGWSEIEETVWNFDDYNDWPESKKSLLEERRRNRS